MAITAAADGFPLGYCNGEVTRTGTQGADGETWVSAAIVLTADMLAPFEGATIGSVRAGLAARTNLDELRVWLRTSLDGDDLASGSITTESDPAIVRGWNEVALATPYYINKGETLYVGYSYKQRGASNAISVVNGQTTGAYYLKAGDEASWVDHSGEGVLSIEAMVTGVHMPDYDVELLSSEGRFNGQGEIELTTTVHNVGTHDIEGFVLSANVIGQQEKHRTMFAGTNIASGASTKVVQTFKPEGEGVGKQYPIEVKLESVSGLSGASADENPDNDVVRAIFSYQRRVLVEEFTGEDCTNCPRAAMFLHQSLHQDGYINSTAMMAHHSGYNPDWLTFRPTDIDYEWFFNGGSVYAPALMLDRMAQEDGDGIFTPCFGPTSREQISAAIAYMLQRPSKAFIDLSATVADKNLTVTVSGGHTAEFGLTPTRLTICLVEDHIAQRAQVSMNQWPDFEHTGVLRAINATWGELVDWNGNLFEMTQTFTLDDEWKRPNLRIIAFLHDYDALDPSRCEVENTAQITLAEADAILTVSNNESARQTVVFDLQGRRLHPSTGSGLRIVRLTAPDGSNYTRKYIH